LRRQFRRDDLGKVARQIDADAVRVRVARVLPLERAADAEELNRKKQVSGKIVLRVAASSGAEWTGHSSGSPPWSPVWRLWSLPSARDRLASTAFTARYFNAAIGSCATRLRRVRPSSQVGSVSDPSEARKHSRQTTSVANSSRSTSLSVRGLGNDGRRRSATHRSQKWSFITISVFSPMLNV
jgi:hypothetical protein